MTTLSNPTLALMIDIVIESADFVENFDVFTLAMAADLHEPDPTIYRFSSLQALLRDRLIRTRDAAEAGDPAAIRSLLAFARLMLRDLAWDPDNRPPDWFEEFREALRADGYELTWQKPEGRRLSYTLLPTDSLAAPLAPEITAVEAELTRRGYSTALNHYHQAVNCLVNHQYESANGALRTTLEEIVSRLDVDHAGGTQSGGGNAINHLISTNTVPENKGGMMLRGLWKMCCSNGSHPGRSNADEARSRLQLVTATIRILFGYCPV